MIIVEFVGDTVGKIKSDFRRKTTNTTAMSPTLCRLLWVVMATVYVVHAKVVDLSHDITQQTFMATADMPKFKPEVLFDGDLVPGVFATFRKYSISEHGGTHMDAPRHFNRKGHTLEGVPIERTIADGVMIDCSKDTGDNARYVVPLQKVKDWEKEHGEIPQKAAVIFNFNWYPKYTDTKNYLGTQDLTNTSTFQFPVVSSEAADFLLEKRDVLIIGTDTMSPDSMTSGYPIHVAMLGKNRLLVENLKNTDSLPPRGFRFHASPVKFVGGTGIQVRAYAMTNLPVGDTGSQVVGCSIMVMVAFAFLVAISAHWLTEL